MANNTMNKPTVITEAYQTPSAKYNLSKRILPVAKVMSAVDLKASLVHLDLKDVPLSLIQQAVRYTDISRTLSGYAMLQTLGITVGIGCRGAALRTMTAQLLEWLLTMHYSGKMPIISRSMLLEALPGTSAASLYRAINSLKAYGYLESIPTQRVLTHIKNEDFYTISLASQWKTPVYIPRHIYKKDMDKIATYSNPVRIAVSEDVLPHVATSRIPLMGTYRATAPITMRVAPKEKRAYTKRHPKFRKSSDGVVGTIETTASRCSVDESASVMSIEPIVEEVAVHNPTLEDAPTQLCSNTTESYIVSQKASEFVHATADIMVELLKIADILQETSTIKSPTLREYFVSKVAGDLRNIATK